MSDSFVVEKMEYDEDESREREQTREVGGHLIPSVIFLLFF